MTPAEYRAEADRLAASGQSAKAAGLRAAATRIERGTVRASLPRDLEGPARAAVMRDAPTFAAAVLERIAAIPVPFDPGVPTFARATPVDGGWGVVFVVGTKPTAPVLTFPRVGQACDHSAALNARINEAGR